MSGAAVKILNIVGARPQFIKYVPVMKFLRFLQSSSETSPNDILVHTGQHYDYEMSKLFFDEFGIQEPTYHLGVGSASHAEQTALIIQRVEEVLLKEQPEVVVVYGDTNSTLGGALAAAKLPIPVAHVEAGLRSFNREMPEEINRILTDHLSTLLFCPSASAVRNLTNKGYEHLLNAGSFIPPDYFTSPQVSNHVLVDANDQYVVNSGDIMYDVLLFAADKARSQSSILDRLAVESKNYLLLTIHRAENTDKADRFAEIVRFVNSVSDGKKVIFPVHPRTRPICEKSPARFSPNVRLVDPIGYFDMVRLLEESSMLMTDSGGMQKEAYWLGVPCITLRQETEWVETVETGWNVLYKSYVGTHSLPQQQRNMYGDGKAAQRIVQGILHFIGQQKIV